MVSTGLLCFLSSCPYSPGARGWELPANPWFPQIRKINLIGLLADFKHKVREEGLDSLNIKVALMGCIVNGPGEAREADLGIAGGKGEGLIFRKGEILRKVPEDRLIDELIAEIKKTYC